MRTNKTTFLKAKKFICIIFVASLSLSLFIGCSSDKDKRSDKDKSDNIKIAYFELSEISAKYKVKEYSNYIDAVCDYYNELIDLCNKLVESDYTILLQSDNLDRYHDLVKTESEALINNISDIEQQQDIADINVVFSATAYYVARYNSKNYLATYDGDEIKFPDEKVDTSIYDDIVIKIEEARSKLTQ